MSTEAETDTFLRLLANLCDTYERASGDTVGLHLTILGEQDLHDEYDWNGESMFLVPKDDLELTGPADTELRHQVLQALRHGKLGKQSRARLKAAIRGRKTS